MYLGEYMIYLEKIQKILHYLIKYLSLSIKYTENFQEKPFYQTTTASQQTNNKTIERNKTKKKKKNQMRNIENSPPGVQHISRRSITTHVHDVSFEVTSFDFR